MANPEQLTCVISGSFKFKPEIDEVYDELQDNGIRVLAPEKGWFYLPQFRIARILEEGDARQLPSEKGMSPLEIENEFLHLLYIANFLYLMNKEGYIGNMVAFELGFALAHQKPIYAHEPLNYERSGFQDLRHWALLKESVRIVPISEIIEDYNEQL